MTYTCIEFSVTDRVALIRLNRPQDGNALTLDMARELLDAATRCEADPGIRAVVLTGAGKMFCAGGDLKAFHQAGEDSARLMREVTLALHAAISCFGWMAPPVICAINGTAAGGGFSLALAPDIALAAASARFTMAYTRAGLAPDGSSSFFLARHIGLRRAKEMALLNPVLTAEQALDWGLVNRVLPDAEVLPAALEMARTLARGPRRAMGEVKRLMLAGASESLETQMERESRAIAAMAASPDGREGIAAFVNKRAPNFAP